MTYHQVKLNLTAGQIRKALKGEPIMLKHTQLGVGHRVHVHGDNRKKLERAHNAGKGVRVHLTQGEIQHDVMKGGSIFDSIKGFLQRNGTDILNGIAGAAKAVIPGSENIVDATRGLVKAATGYGISSNSRMVKGSAEAKAHMARVRSMRSSKSKVQGGSFLAN